MERIEFTRCQRVLLEQLVSDWQEKAQRALRADGPNGQRMEEVRRVASELQACADQLRGLISTGDLPVHFGFQIRRTPHRGLIGGRG